MSEFEFVFSLFGLLLGLALAEILGGLSQYLRRGKKEEGGGYLTPLLGLFVMLDLTSFWAGAWQLREVIPPVSGALGIGLLITGIYYLAASMVFPGSNESWEDLDQRFFEKRYIVLGGVALTNGLTLISFLALRDRSPDTSLILILSLYYALILIALLTRNKLLSLASVLGLIALWLLEMFASLGAFRHVPSFF